MITNSSSCSASEQYKDTSDKKYLQKLLDEAASTQRKLIAYVKLLQPAHLLCLRDPALFLERDWNLHELVMHTYCADLISISKEIDDLISNNNQNELRAHYRSIDCFDQLSMWSMAAQNTILLFDLKQDILFSQSGTSHTTDSLELILNKSIDFMSHVIGNPNVGNFLSVETATVLQRRVYTAFVDSCTRYTQLLYRESAAAREQKDWQKVSLITDKIRFHFQQQLKATHHYDSQNQYQISTLCNMLHRVRLEKSQIAFYLREKQASSVVFCADDAQRTSKAEVAITFL